MVEPILFDEERWVGTIEFHLAPFCSKHCADVDLHKWLKGSYVLPEDGPGDPEEGADEEG